LQARKNLWTSCASPAKVAPSEFLQGSAILAVKLASGLRRRQHAAVE
jgi:hypothetical protein